MRVSCSNRNVGGNVIESSGTWTVVRGLGLIEDVTDLEHVVIGAEVPSQSRRDAGMSNEQYAAAVLQSLIAVVGAG